MKADDTFVCITHTKQIKLLDMEKKIDNTLDCKGLSCPMPMMKLAKAMKGLKSEQILEMLGTDPGTKSDLPRWCTKTGNILLEENELPGGITQFIIQKK